MELASVRIRNQLEQLLSSSDKLHLTIWIDGQYTPLELLADGRWAKGRELHFRIEGTMKQGVQRLE